MSKAVRGEVVIGELEYEAIERRLDAYYEAMNRIREIADVMIGDGPGAVKAYYGPHEDGFPRGLPTSFSHLRDHAKQIRRLVNDTVGDRQ